MGSLQDTPYTPTPTSPESLMETWVVERKWFPEEAACPLSMGWPKISLFFFQVKI